MNEGIRHPLSGHWLPVGAAHQELLASGILQKPENGHRLSTDIDSERELMKSYVTGLREQGIEASGQVGYATIITTRDWIITGTDQGDIGRVIMTSHINPDSLTEIGGGSTKLDERAQFSQQEIEGIKKAMLLPEFKSGDEFKATRGLLEYETKIVIVTSTGEYSPVRLCAKELTSRMYVNTPKT